MDLTIQHDLIAGLRFDRYVGEPENEIALFGPDRHPGRSIIPEDGAPKFGGDPRREERTIPIIIDGAGGVTERIPHHLFTRLEDRTHPRSPYANMTLQTVSPEAAAAEKKPMSVLSVAVAVTFPEVAFQYADAP